MKLLSEKARNVLRNVYRGLGVTAVSLVFQACYGTPPDRGEDAVIRGIVRSKTGQKPIPGIKVSIESLSPFDLTDREGHFYIYVPKEERYVIKFEDVDGPENGSFKEARQVIALTDTEQYLTVDLDAE